MRDRVIELRRVKASELIPNDKNWRLHPDMQKQALSGVLADVGMVTALIARQLPDGKLELIDGHLRADLAKDAEVPVVIVDLDDEEAKKVLLTFDPIGDLAKVDDDQLRELIGTVEFDESADLRHMLAKMSDKLADEESSEEEDSTKAEVPGMVLQPHEHYDYLVVLATTAQEWNVLCERLGLKPEKRRGNVGTCRALICVDEREAADYGAVVPQDKLLVHPPVDGLPGIMNWMMDAVREPIRSERRSCSRRLATCHWHH